jgi:hypothetical protein
MIYRGSKDCLFDAVDSIRAQFPGATILLVVGIPGTTSTLSYTNLDTYEYDMNDWDSVMSIINDLREII